MNANWQHFKVASRSEQPSVSVSSVSSLSRGVLVLESFDIFHWTSKIVFRRHKWTNWFSKFRLIYWTILIWKQEKLSSIFSHNYGALYNFAKIQWIEYTPRSVQRDQVVLRIKYLECRLQWRIKLTRILRAPSQSNCFHFHAVFGQNFAK